MICGDVSGRIKRFLEDLLDEQEYQEVRAHLEECAACHDYAKTLGSLSYQLKEMGETEAPKDLLPSILYYLRHASSHPAVKKLSEDIPKKSLRVNVRLPKSYLELLTGLSVAVVLFFAFLLYRSIGHSKSKTAHLTDPAPVQNQIIPKSLNPAPVKKEGPLEFLRWELYLPSQTHEKLFDVFGELGVSVDYRSPNLVVVTLSKDLFRDLIFKIKSIEGVRADFGKDYETHSDASVGFAQIAIYLSEEGNLS